MSTDDAAEAAAAEWSALAYRLTAVVSELGEAQRAAGLAGTDPTGADVPAVLRTLREALPALDEDELTGIGVAVMEWCSACYQLGRTARRIRRRDFDSGRRLGRAEAAEEQARQAWALPLLAAVSAGPKAPPE